jgi:hypothetical protein
MARLSDRLRTVVSRHDVGRIVTRIFRVWEKKRGHRHTGSRLVGSAGEALFFGLLFVLGSVCLASVITSQVVHPTPELYTPGFGFWLMVLVLTSFVVIGGGGVVYTVIQLGASVERRSALVRRAAGIDLIRDALPTVKEFPTIPRDVHLTNSPGVTLAFRLPVFQSSAWKLWFATLFCLTLSGLTSVLIVVAVNSHLLRDPEWFLTILLIPLIASNVWAVVHFAREFWRQARVGPTCVEISDHPLRPGREYAIFLSQAGRTSFGFLELSLICAEEATYHQGTDIRRETRVVFEQCVFRRQSVRIDRRSPFEIKLGTVIPDQAMHSFQSAHNAVHWKLVVRGQPDMGRAFERSFPVIVYPTCSPSAGDSTTSSAVRSVSRT